MNIDWMDLPIKSLEWTGVHITVWKIIGYTGALMFAARWLVQFAASKKAGKPVLPRLFWYLSVLGSVMSLSYFVFSAKQDSVGILQNLFPVFISSYNLFLDIKHHGWDKKSQESMPFTNEKQKKQTENNNLKRNINSKRKKSKR